jgi:pimeloyl-ACP methyl ester carboxylesterase
MRSMNTLSSQSSFPQSRLFRVGLGFGLLLLLLAGGYIALNWAPDRPAESLKARWAKPPSQFVALGGMQVHFRDEGPKTDPLPIVLIHGTSASLHTWEGWTQELKVQRRVIRMDLPGFALTGPNPENDYSLPVYAKFVKAFLDQLGVRQCVLGGNSLGGGIAWTTAHDYPELVSKLVLVDASGYPPESAKAPPSVPLGFKIARLPVLRELMKNVLPRQIVAKSLANVYGDPRKVNADLVDLYYEMALREGNRKALGRRMDQGYSGVVEHIAQLKLPTLILWGGQDRLVPLEFGERFAKDIVGAKLVVFDELGHVPHEENPERTLEALKTFLAE